ncbi:lipopolysaccharide biosynthesis protein [Vibrio sp. 10N.222.55.F12]|uniref:lipopolysaccharide biosynthesis protein n=1 Tax=Vibrio sp. 10N.222.55.F12 TaxID=3229653 RepID=UPI00355414C4
MNLAVKLKLPVLVSYLNTLANLIAGVLITPILIDVLGSDEYGIYTVLSGILSVFLIFDFGLPVTLNRFISKYRSKGDYENLSKLISLVSFVFKLTSVLFLCFSLSYFFEFDLLGIFKYLNSLSGSEGIEESVIYLIISLSFFSLTLSVNTNFRCAVLNAYELFIVVRLSLIVGSIVRVFLIYMLFKEGSGLTELFVINLFVSMVVMLFVSKYYSELANKYFGGDYRQVTLDYSLSIFKYTFWAFLYSIVFSFFWNITQAIIAQDLGSGSAGAFAIVIMLVGILGSLITNVTALLMPTAARDLINKTPKNLQISVRKISRFLMLFYTLILVSFILLGDVIIQMWLSEYQHSYIVYKMTVIVFMGYFIPLTQSYFIQIGDVKGLIKFKSLCNAFFIGISILTIYICEFETELNYVFTIVSMWVLSQVCIQIYYTKKIGFNVLVLELYPISISSFFIIISLLFKGFFL